MVVVGIDGRRLQRGRGDTDVIGALLDCGAELAQLGGHCGDTVGFLDPPAGDVAQRGRALGKQRGGGQRHRCVRNVVAVEIDGNQPALRRTRGHPVRPGFDDGAHLCQRLGEFDVALD